MGKRELIALLNLSSWCLVMVERLLLAVPRGCLQFVNVVFPDHTHLLFLKSERSVCKCTLGLYADLLYQRVWTWFFERRVVLVFSSGHRGEFGV